MVKPEDMLKEPFVLEFLGLDEKTSYSETDLEQAIINRLEHFLLEPGKGFLFEARSNTQRLWRCVFQAWEPLTVLTQAPASRQRGKAAILSGIGRVSPVTMRMNPSCFDGTNH